MGSKRMGTIFVIIFCLMVGSLSIEQRVYGQPNQILNDGQIIYQWLQDEEWGEDRFQTKFRIECIEEVTIEIVSSKVMRFTKTLKLEITNAYLYGYSEETAYTPDSFNWVYFCEEGGAEWFHGKEHIITVIREIDRETGLRIKAENPYGVYEISVGAGVQYIDDEGKEYTQMIGLRIPFGDDWTHSDLYCEEASDLQIGDIWRGYDVVSYSELRGRKTIVLESDFPETMLEFDKETGLLVSDYSFEGYGTGLEGEVYDWKWFERSILYQEVFPSETTTQQPLPQTSQELPPETITETVTIETTTELEISTSDPVIVTVTEREESAFIPSFTAIFSLFGLVALALWRKRT